MIVQTPKAAPKRLIDPQAVADALRLIVGEGAVTEVRCLEAWDDNPRWCKTFAGYFDDFDKAATDLGKLRGAKGLYFTLNPVNPKLLARAKNRLKVQGKGDATGDGHIVGRRWLPIDCDAKRPSGISSDDAEHEAAIDRAYEIRDYLTNEGWPEPIVADSGNGAHLLYRIDEPADDDGLVKRVIESLDKRFSDDTVDIDKSVANPSRIWKLYGTLACKGDDTPESPHRMSSILTVPAEVAVVTTGQLKALAGPVEVVKPVSRSNGSAESLDIEAFIARHGLEVDPPRDWNGGKLWTLRVSPLCDHGGDGPFIARHASGAAIAKCQHNSCDWSWHDLREQFEPKAERLKQPTRYADSVLADLDPTAAPEAIEAVEPPTRYQPFPVDVLPGCLGGFAIEVARVVQVDPIYAVLPGLVSAASAIGGSRRVELNPDWHEPSILWGALVADSGDGKSPAADKLLAPARAADAALKPINAEREAEYEDAKRIFAADHEKWKSDRKAKKTDAPPPRPPEPPVIERRVVSDITPEALIPILEHNDRLLSDRDELSGFLGGMGRYSDGKGVAERAAYLSLYTANPIRVDRKTGDRKSLQVESPYLSIFGGVQPGLLHSVMSADDVAAGLPARFLWAMPPTRAQRYRRDRICPEARTAYERAIEALYELKPGQNDFGEPVPMVLSLSVDAEVVFGQCVDRLNDRRADSSGPIRGALSKLKATCGRLALVIHCLRDAEGDLPIGEELTIDADTIRSAATITEWFAGEAERVFAMRGESADDQATRELVRWIEGKGGSVTERELARGPRQYRGTGVAGAALQALVEVGYGSWQVESTATNQKRIFELATAATVTDSPETRDTSESVAVASVTTPEIADPEPIDDDGWEAA